MHDRELIAVRGYLSFGFPIPWDCAGMIPPPPGHAGSPGLCKATLCMSSSRAPADISVQPVHSHNSRVKRQERVADQAPGAQTCPWPRKVN